MKPSENYFEDNQEESQDNRVANTSQTNKIHLQRFPRAEPSKESGAKRKFERGETKRPFLPVKSKVTKLQKLDSLDPIHQM